jgi:hypothetical protein
MMRVNELPKFLPMSRVKYVTALIFAVFCVYVTRSSDCSGKFLLTIELFLKNKNKTILPYYNLSANVWGVDNVQPSRDPVTEIQWTSQAKASL